MRITWWGHATVTLDIGGVRLLTDPVLSARLGHLRRLGGPVPSVDAVRADVVLVSHLHLDHLHRPSLRRVNAPVIAPRGSAGLIADVQEVEVGESVRIGDVTVRAVAAAHDGRRWTRSRHVGPALGYVVSDGTQRVWFAGDTGLFDDMSDIGPVDVAVVPVGGWGPTLGPDHLDPVQAAEAVRRVGARVAVPIHYGTFWPVGLPTDRSSRMRELFAEPGRRFAAACPSARLVSHGSTIEA